MTDEHLWNKFNDYSFAQWYLCKKCGAAKRESLEGRGTTYWIDFICAVEQISLPNCKELQFKRLLE